MPADYTLLRTFPEWEALVPEWMALWEASAAATPFQHPAWLLPWRRAFAHETLLSVAIRRGGELIGLAPFYVYPDPHTGERQLLIIGAGTSDYLDGIFRSDCSRDDIGRALTLVGAHGAWDRAYFAQLRPHSVLLAAFKEAAGVTISPGEPCGHRPAVPIGELPPKLRAEVRYRQNAARALGKLRFEQASEPEWPTAFDLLVRFHTERWRGAGEAGVLADEAVLAHHRAALPELLARGLARLGLLWAGTQPLGVLYSLADPPGRPVRTQYFYLMGYAPEHARLRPGILLLAHAIEEAARAGFVRVDMLRGEETYKKFWRLDPVPTFSCSFRPEHLGRF